MSGTHKSRQPRTYLRDAVRERGMYESSVEDVVKLLHAPEIRVEPEDFIDFILNTGNRHRVVEGWSLLFGEKGQTQFAGNHYPEKAFVDGLVERFIGEKGFEPDIGKRILHILHGQYSLILRADSDEITDVCMHLDKHRRDVNRLAGVAHQLAVLERAARTLGVYLCSKTYLRPNFTERRIRLPPAEYLAEIRDGDSPVPLNTALCTVLTHFNAYTGRAGFGAFCQSEEFKPWYTHIETHVKE